jgi:hypothetical protein
MLKSSQLSRKSEKFLRTSRSSANPFEIILHGYINGAENGGTRQCVISALLAVLLAVLPEVGI